MGGFLLRRLAGFHDDLNMAQVCLSQHSWLVWNPWLACLPGVNPARPDSLLRQELTSNAGRFLELW